MGGGRKRGRRPSVSTPTPPAPQGDDAGAATDDKSAAKHEEHRSSQPKRPRSTTTASRHHAKAASTATAKADDDDDDDPTNNEAIIAYQPPPPRGGPQSKKERRAALKAARMDPARLAAGRAAQRARERAAVRQLVQRQRRERKLRRRRNRQENAPGGDASFPENKKQKRSPAGMDATTATDDDDDGNRDTDREVAQKVWHQIKYGTTDEATGWTTLALGVQYKDVVVGKGAVLCGGKAKLVVTIRYQLTGGRLGAVLDASRRFCFATGAGQVVRGWELGMAGMRVGGRRRLRVPPKAGYGSRDIGAGPGAVLHFDITLLSFR